MTGPAQTPATLNDVRTIPGPSPGGRFELRLPAVGRLGPHPRELDAVPPVRHRGSIRRASCPATRRTLADPNVQTAPPLYSIWMFTPSQNTILPVMPPVEGVMVTEAVAAQPRTPLPAVILDKKPPLDLDSDLVAEGVGLLSIRSVYDIMGVDQARTEQRRRQLASPTFRIPPTRRTPIARRASCASRSRVSIPDDDDIADPDNSAFGPTGVMREIVGYAPVEPDGSVRMKVPANIAFQISLLDANGRRVSPRASLLAARAPGRSARVQRLPRAHREPQTPTVARPQGSRSIPRTPARPRPAPHSRARVNTISPEAGDTMAQRALARRLVVHRPDDHGPSAADRSRSRRAPTWCTTRSGNRPRRRPTRSRTTISS